jgi:hypothetical protein
MKSPNLLLVMAALNPDEPARIEEVADDAQCSSNTRLPRQPAQLAAGANTCPSLSEAVTVTTPAVTLTANCESWFPAVAETAPTAACAIRFDVVKPAGSGIVPPLATPEPAPNAIRMRVPDRRAEGEDHPIPRRRHVSDNQRAIDRFVTADIRVAGDSDRGERRVALRFGETRRRRRCPASTG